MASTGNPNQPIPFDMQKFFKPSIPNPSPNQPNPSAPYPTPTSSYPPPSPAFFHPQYQQFYMPPSSAPHPNFQNAPQPQPQDAKSLSFPSPPLAPFNAGTQILALINSSPQNPDFPPPQPSQPPPVEFLPPNVGPLRLPSCKVPRGRRLSGAQLTYDIDSRLSGEVQPQLEVTPITKYGSDPQLVVGRQIAVNKSYICYGLKGGNIRILNINTALRSLFRGHTQRVTDMAFFAEDVHLLASVSLEGRVFVWKISEGPDEEDKPQITGKIVIGVQILGDEEYVHPRICWHRHKQEVLVAGIGKHILRIDTMKAGKSGVFSTDSPSPLQCPIDKLIDGIQLTQAIQQYALELCQCIPPPLDNTGLEKSESSISRDANIEGFDALDPPGNKPSELSLYGSVPKPGTHVSSAESSTIARYPSSSTIEANTAQAALASTASDADIGCVASPPPHPPSPRLSRRPSGFHSPATSFEPTPQLGDHVGNQMAADYSIDRQMDTFRANLSDMHSSEDGSRNDEKKVVSDEKSNVCSPPIIFKQPTHLVTPSEILMATSSAEITNVTEGKNEGEMNIHDVVVNTDVRNAELEVKVVDEARSSLNDEFDSPEETQNRNLGNRERFFCSQASDLGIQMARDHCAISRDEYIGESHQADRVTTLGSSVQPNVGEEDIHDSRKDLSGKVSESAMPSTFPQSPVPSTKSKKQKGKSSQASGQSSPPSSAFNSADSSAEPGGNPNLPTPGAAFPQIAAMQEMLSQLITTQKEMQKQMSNIVNLPVTKEGRRLEAALGRSIEKAIKGNTDALWARFQEENAKNEKLSRERTQQIMSLITNFVNKDLAVMLDKAVKKEITAIGPSVIRTITPAIEKTVTSAITDSFQRGVGDKAVNQLEKSVNSKLEAIVARQIQAQFQTSGRQALQEALKSSVEALVIPAFEMSCKAMFEQVDAAFQKGMVEHTNAAQQQFESSSSSLAIALRDSLNSASSIAKTLSGEFADGQRKILALAAAGANSNVATPLASQLSNGPLSALHDKVEVAMDPTKELSKLVSERKYDEAFTMALQRSDLSIVAWLCSQQLACDLNKDTPRKLAWMVDVATAINPGDQMIAVHVRPIFQEVYKRVHEISSSPLLTGADHASIRALFYVINYVLMTCK
ncbi:hypothetical protein COLO4_07762 [Corchorus olitorius]|uniref:Enhancer of mRNA-decapping protein 4 WD40 repeat region domain-containing protein n=1 Tax=Corchorus olitorius TaxID=93759 RepID=A0A1R3KIQ7_9ROSI|nr:hypothetical protein COLO4_07762 [Corchorus olitorius]